MAHVLKSNEVHRITGYRKRMYQTLSTEKLLHLLPSEDQREGEVENPFLCFGMRKSTDPPWHPLKPDRAVNLGVAEWRQMLFDEELV